MTARVRRFRTINPTASGLATYSPIAGSPTPGSPIAGHAAAGNPAAGSPTTGHAGSAAGTTGAAIGPAAPYTDEPLVPSSASALVDVNLDPPFTRHPALLLAAPGFTERFRPRVLSTTLALLWVADGRRAGYVTYGDLRDSVHFAAGIAICRAAGCVVSGIEGQPLHTGAFGLVAAADREAHAALCAISQV